MNHDHTQAPPAPTEPGPEALDQALYRLQTEDASAELTDLTDSAFNDLTAAYDQQPAAPQAAALERALVTLEQAQALAATLLPTAAGSPSLSLHRLIEDVTLLCADTARRQGVDMAALVYQDLPEWWQADATLMRALLHALCTHILARMQAGSLIIRAMTGESAAAPEQESDAGQQAALPLRFTLTTYPHHQADGSQPAFQISAPDSPLGKYCAQSGARLGHDPTERVLWLEMELVPHSRQPPPPYPARQDTPVRVFHPLAAVRQSLIHRLRRMRFTPIELQHPPTASADTSDAAALLLALPSDTSPQCIDAWCTAAAELPVLLLTDTIASQPSTRATRVTRLPRHISDGCLYRSLNRVTQHHYLRQALVSRDPATAIALVGGNTQLAADLHACFIADLRASLGQLRSLATQGDWQQLGEVVHKFKGSSAYCGVPALRHALTRLDACLRGANPERSLFFLRRVEAETAILTANPDESA